MGVEQRLKRLEKKTPQKPDLTGLDLFCAIMEAEYSGRDATELKRQYEEWDSKRVHPPHVGFDALDKLMAEMEEEFREEGKA